MKLPYDIRRMIYKYFFPSKTNIHLTYGTIGEGYLRFAVPVISKNVLRVSRQIQQEAYQVLYGSNTFSINLEEDTYHGHVRDYPYRELHKQCHTVTDLFLRWMHSSTRLLIPELHLTLLGSEYPMVHLHQYLRGLADFQCVTITVLPKEWEMGDTKGAPWTPLWNYIGLIGAVRRVLGPHNNVTYWDDLGEVSSAANFQEILPDAIQRVTSIEDRTWWIAHKASL